MGLNEVPHRCRENIERRAERALAHYLPRTLIEAGATPVAELAMTVSKDLMCPSLSTSRSEGVVRGSRFSGHATSHEILTIRFERWMFEDRP